MPDPTAPVVTRFAPSPTGELHVGGARTALYSWALARRHGGRFLLRFEDTDLARSSAEAADRIAADLHWFGLEWDNPGGVIPRQSERHAEGVYDAAVEKLLAEDRAYEKDGAVLFRFGFDTAFDDAVYGRVETPASDNRDFVIRKGEAGGGMPTFHLAVVVDDHDAGVTHVVRGQEHLSNTPKHAALCDALGFDRPVWAHTPSILNPGGSKMSKRDKARAARAAAQENPKQELVLPGVEPDALAAFLAKDNDDDGIANALAAALDLALPEVEVADFRRAGYLAAVVANYVALLGWNPGDDRERFSMEELARSFDLGRVNKANSTFDRKKLAAFHQDTLIAMDPAAFASALRDHLAAYRNDFLAGSGRPPPRRLRRPLPAARRHPRRRGGRRPLLRRAPRRLRRESREEEPHPAGGRRPRKPRRHPRRPRGRRALRRLHDRGRAREARRGTRPPAPGRPGPTPPRRHDRHRRLPRHRPHAHPPRQSPRSSPASTAAWRRSARQPAPLIEP